MRGALEDVNPTKLNVTSSDEYVQNPVLALPDLLTVYSANGQRNASQSSSSLCLDSIYVLKLLVLEVHT